MRSEQRKTARQLREICLEALAARRAPGYFDRAFDTNAATRASSRAEPRPPRFGKSGSRKPSMANLNKVLLLGNVTRDPEVRYTPKGSAVCDLGIAVNRSYTTDSGEKREEVTFVDVTLWGRTAEVASEYLKKGRPVFIEGRLQMDSWDDKQTGQKRTRLRVVAENMQLLGGRPPGGAEATGESRQTSAPPKKSAGPEPDEDEIPF